jgi:hypothetical protein
MKYVIPVVLLLVLALAQIPTAQENGDGFSWADLRADTIIFDFPAPDSIEVNCKFSIFNNTLFDTIIASEIGIFLDGIPMGGEPIDVTKSMNNCHVFNTSEECKGECYYTTIPPIEFGECEWYIVPVNPGPPDSIVTRPWCACMKDGEISWTVHYTGQDIVKFVLDPANVVWEPDETNNSFSTHLRPVAVRHETWGKIKSLYAE